MPMDFQLKSICDHQHKEIEELEQQLKQTQDRLKDAESVIEFYAHDYMFKRLAKEFPNFGDSAREYLKKYGESDLEFKGACYACEVVAETNIKLQKALDVAMVAIELGSKLNSYSDAVNTKYECNESKHKIQSILEGESE